MILSQLRPADLLLAISASPLLFRCYQESRISILRNLSLNTIHPGNLQLAWAVLGVPTFTAPTERFFIPDYQRRRHSENDLDRMNETVQACFDQAKVSTGITMEIDNTIWTRLFKLCYITDFFIAAYAEGALMRLHCAVSSQAVRRGLDMPTLSSSANAPLSDTEHARLQRAFFNFEFCRKTSVAVRCLNDWTTDDVHGAVAGMTKVRLNRWEAEELETVMEFVRRYARTAAEEIEDRFLQEAGGSPSGQTGAWDALTGEPALPKSPYEVPSWAWDTVPYVRLYGLVAIDHHGRRQAGQPDFMLDLGLAFLKRLKTVGTTEQRAMLRLYSWRTSGAWVNTCLARQRVRSEGARHDLAAHRDRLSEPNAGYRWIENMPTGSRECTYEALFSAGGHTVPETGLVFWSRDRLKDMMVFEFSTKELGIVPYRIEPAHPWAAIPPEDLNSERYFILTLSDPWRKEEHCRLLTFDY